MQLWAVFIGYLAPYKLLVLALFHLHQLLLGIGHQAFGLFSFWFYTIHDMSLGLGMFFHDGSGLSRNTVDYSFTFSVFCRAPPGLGCRYSSV